jgi:hypothetical protein
MSLEQHNVDVKVEAVKVFLRVRVCTGARQSPTKVGAAASDRYFLLGIAEQLLHETF